MYLNKQGSCLGVTKFIFNFPSTYFFKPPSLPFLPLGAKISKTKKTPCSESL